MRPQRRNSFLSTNPLSFSSSSFVNFSRAFVVWCFLWCVFALKMIETSKVSFLVFFYRSKTQRKTLRETSFFSRRKLVFFTTHTIERVFFRFFSTFVYRDETLKNTQDTKKTRCLLLFALRSKKCEYYFITTIRTTIKLLLLRRW